MPIVYSQRQIQEIGSVLSMPGGGTTIQMIEIRSTATLTTNNWSTQNELFTGSITPTSASNKILIYVYAPFRSDAGAGTWSLGFFWVHNTTRNVNIITSGWTGNWRNSINSYTRQFLDNPNSTATQTYSFRVGNHPAGAVAWNNSNSQSSDGYAYMRLMEIAV